MNLNWLLTLLFVSVLLVAAIHSPSDLAAKIAVGLQLLYYSGVMLTEKSTRNIQSNRVLLLVLWLTFLTLTASIAVRILCLQRSNEGCPPWLLQMLDFDCVKGILSLNIGVCESLQLASVAICLIKLFVTPRTVELRNWERLQNTSRLVAVTSRYLSIGLLYGLICIEEGRLQTFWSCIMCFYIVFGGGNHVVLLKMVNVLIAAELFCEFAILDPFFNRLQIIDYFFGQRTYNPSIPHSFEVTIAVKLALFMCVASQLAYYVEIEPLKEVTDVQSRMLFQRRKASAGEASSTYQILLVHAATLYVLLTRTTPGCIALAIALSFNLPTIKLGHRPLLLMGASTCLISDPTQLSLFGYLLLVTFLRITPATLPTIPLFWLTGSARVIILFSRVSVVNFLAGLLNYQYLVFTAIVVRIASRMLGYDNEIMGLDDSYGFVNLKEGAFGDVFLWILLLATRMNGESSHYSRLLLWFFGRLECLLHFLRYFHWFAYTLACGIVLAADQAAFTLIEFVLVIALICTQVFLKGQNKNQRLKKLWSIYMGWLFLKIALKYFYMFSQYAPEWIVFSAIKPYQRLVGLENPNTPPSKAFVEEGIMLIIGWISRYVQNIKIAYRGNVRLTQQNPRPQLVSSERKLDLFNTNPTNTFSKIRTSVLQPDAEDIAYIYEHFIAPAKSAELSQWGRLLHQLLTKPLLDINFLTILLVYLLTEFRFEYVLYGVVMAVYYLKVNLMEENFHELFAGASNIAVYSGEQIQQTKRSIKTTYNQTSSLSRQANLATIVVSTVSVLVHYLQLLLKALYYGQFESKYKFQDILPQFIIVIVSILVRQLSPQQRESDCDSLIIRLDQYNERIVYYIGISIVKVAQRLLLVYLVTLLLNRDASGLLILGLLIAQKFISQGIFVASAALIALGGVALGHANCIPLLILGKLLLYSKFKVVQTLANNQQDSNRLLHQENLFNCVIRYVPTLLGLLAVACVIISLQMVNVPFLLGLIGLAAYREVITDTGSRPKWALLVMLIYSACLFVVKIYFNFYHEQFWLSHTQIFLLLSLLSLNFDLINNEECRRRSQLASQHIEQKGCLVGQLLGYLKNEFKLESLKRYYIERRSLSDKIMKVKRELESSRRENLDSYGQLLLVQEDEREDNYARLLNSVLFYSIPHLHQLHGFFHHYIGKTLVLNAHIDEVQRRVLQEFDHNFTITLEKIIKSQVDANKPRQLQMKEQELGLASEQVIANLLPDIVPKLEERLESVEELTSLQKQNNYQQYHLTLLKKFMPENDSWETKLGKYVLANFDYVGFIALIGWNFAGGLYTLPANVLVFAWAIPLSGKTPMRFWVLLLLYLTFIMSLKMFLPVLPASHLLEFVFSTAKDKYLYEYFLMVVLTSEIIVSQLYGDSSKHEETFQDSLFRTALNRASFGITHDNDDKRFLQYYRTLKGERFGFLSELFSKLNMKPGRDFYPLICATQVCLCLYILLLYDMVEYENRKNITSLEEVLSYNQFSKHMVIALFLQIVVMIADRFVTTYNYHDPGEQALQGFLLRYTFDPTLNPQEAQQNTFRLRSSYDVPLIIKYIIHLIVLAVVNMFVFMYVPGGGKHCEASEEANTCEPKFFYLMGFFGIYLVYFFFNAQQIRYGFTRLKGKNTLMMGFHFLYMYLYKGFMAVPFLSEFKKLADWTLTSTGLPLFHWLKFEDIHSRLYVCKCETEMLKRKPFGVETWWVRYLIAPAGFVSILLIIFGPLLAYSTANPFAVMDEVIGAEVQLTLQLNGLANYDLFENSHVVKIRKVPEGISNEHIYNSGQKSLYEVQMNKFPDSNMLLSEPVLDSIVRKMTEKIEHKELTTFRLLLRVDIIEREGGKSKHEWSNRELSAQQLRQFLGLMNGTNNRMELRQFYSPLPGRMKGTSLFIRTHEKYWQVFSHNDILQLYYITASKFKVRFGVVTFYLTYVLLISRLFRFYLTANVENAIFEGSELQRVLYLCSAVISARRLENFEEEEYFYFELMDLIRSPQKMLRTTGSLKEFRLRC